MHVAVSTANSRAGRPVTASTARPGCMEHNSAGENNQRHDLKTIRRVRQARVLWKLRIENLQSRKMKLRIPTLEGSFQTAVNVADSAPNTVFVCSFEGIIFFAASWQRFLARTTCQTHFMHTKAQAGLSHHRCH